MKLKREGLSVFLWLGPLLLYFPVVLFDSLPFFGTVSLQFVPWRWAGWQILRAGEWPLWNSLSGFGAPLAANYQSAFFYPFNWLQFPAAVIGGPAGVAWMQGVIIGVHLAFAGWGMARLGRSLGLGSLAQGISGLAYGLSGYLVARAHFPSIVVTAAWIPWLLLFVNELIVSEGQARRRKAAWTALAIGNLLLAGHAQTAWYAMLLASAWAIFRLLAVAHSRRRGGNEAGLTGSGMQAVGFLSIAVVVGVLMAAVQLVPTAELLGLSQRAGGADEAFVMTYSFWPWRFLGLVLPGFFGSPVNGDYWGYANFWEDAVYIGLLPFLLAVRAVFRKGGDAHRPLVRFLASAVLLAFLLALGNNTPIFPFLYRNVPTFDLFQAPTRISILAVLSLSLLAGIGAQDWAAGLSSFSRKQARRWTAAGIAVALAGGVSLVFLDFLPASFGRAVLIAGLIGACGALLGVARKRDVPWRYGVMLLVAADLVIAGWGLNPGFSADFYSQVSPNAPALRDEIGTGRIYLFADDAYEMTFSRYFRFDRFPSDEVSLRSSMLPNLAMLDGIRSANQFDPLVPERYAEYINLLEGADPEFQSWMLSQGTVTVTERYLAGEESPLRFETRSARPRVEWFACAVSVPGKDAAFAALKTMADAREMGLVVESGMDEGCEPEQGGEAEIIEESANRLVVHVEAPAPGWLLLRDTVYPGWRATVGGEEAEILPGNALFRAVNVPAGASEVVFEYAPASFKLGAAGSLVGLVCLGFLFRPGRKEKE